MVKPCCCVNPQLGGKIASVTQIMGALILAGESTYKIYLLDTVKVEGTQENQENVSTAKVAGMIVSIIWIIFSICHSILAFVLWTGSQQLSLKKLRTWFVSTSVLLPVHLLLLLIVLFCIPEIPQGPSTKGTYLQFWKTSLLLIHILKMIIIAFLLWSVGHFIHEIKQNELVEKR